MANKSNQRWLKEHFSDLYVKEAKKAGYRSRAVYKLIDIYKRDRLFKPGMTVLDLGAAPGSWSQALCQWVKPQGRVIALDRLPMQPIPGVMIVQGDFLDPKINEKLKKITAEKFDWIVSDMAPNLSGIPSVDIPEGVKLIEAILAFALQTLNREGGLLLKVFQGAGVEDLIREMRRYFKNTVIRKPKASRSRSREVYVVARKFNFPLTS